MNRFALLACAVCAPLLLQSCLAGYEEKYRLRRESGRAEPRPPLSKPEPPKENSVSTCWNGLDDDSDGLADCRDEECRAILIKCHARDSLPPDRAENSPDRCANGIDDDLDGLIDCRDTECGLLKVCDTTRHPPLLPEVEDAPGECSDGVDNDRDGEKDCAEAACARLQVCKPSPPANPEDDREECQDQRDNDSDGQADCADPGCSQAWSFCSSDGGIFPDRDWFARTREVHVLPGTVEAEYFIDPQVCLDSAWGFSESDVKVNTGGTRGLVPGCRDDAVRLHGVEVTGSGDPSARAPERYSGGKCPSDAAITYLRFGERLSYALVVEKPLARYRVKARVASGKFAEDPMRNPPYLFSLNFHHPGDRLRVKASLIFHVLNTGGWHAWGDFLPQAWAKGTPYTGDCTRVMAGHEALQSGDCWVRQLPEETLSLPKGQWIMELVSQEGSYNVGYFEFQEIGP